MSFQDVGRKGGRGGRSAQRGRRPVTSGVSSTSMSSPNMDNSSAASKERSGLYSQASDSILQYQKNVGLLENMYRQIGTRADGPVLETQFRVQVGVVNELGSKIDSQLRSLESKLFSANGNLATNMSRTEAAQYRATHVKLTRDFRSVETKCKKLLLEAKRKRDYLEAQKRNKVLEEQEREQQKKDSLNSGDALLRVQMQEDQIAREIMRERQEEIQNINKGMHTVNEIYKDLANIVGTQQEQIDTIEKDTEISKTNTESALQQVEKANQADSQQCIIC